MVNRVLLDTNGLKVSAIGKDVFTASNADLLLNSNFITPNLLISGTYTVTSTRITYVYIPFGKRFTKAPMFAVQQYLPGTGQIDEFYGSYDTRGRFVTVPSRIKLQPTFMELRTLVPCTFIYKVWDYSL